MKTLRSGRLEHSGTAPAIGRNGMGLEANVATVPLQSWRAWSECGDGAQLHLVIDPAAGQVWLLPADGTPTQARSIE